MCIGYTAKKLLLFSQYNAYIDKESFLAYSLAMSGIVIGLLGLLKSNEFIGTFVAAIVLSWDDWLYLEIKDEKIQEVLDLCLNLSYFVIFGALLPWDQFHDYGNGISISLGKLLLCALFIFLFRRLPVILLLSKFIPNLNSRKEAIFLGWFGPIGSGAVYFANQLLIISEYNSEVESFVKQSTLLIYFIVMCSIIVHGITIPLFKMTIQATLSVTNFNISLLEGGRSSEIGKELFHPQLKSADYMSLDMI